MSTTYHDPDVEERLGNVDEYLISCLGFTVRQNAWAGPEHWKYRKTKGIAMGSRFKSFCFCKLASS